MKTRLSLRAEVYPPSRLLEVRDKLRVNITEEETDEGVAAYEMIKRKNY